MNLNQRAFEICRRMTAAAAALRIDHEKLGNGTLVVDCGANVAGGLEAGRLLAECSMAGLGQVSFVPQGAVGHGPAIQVTTDQPVAACLAAQYAGWEIKLDDFFAMGSGPMRAAANREDLFENIGYAEEPEIAVGVLETRQAPTTRLAKYLAERCRVAEDSLVLLYAPTASQAGNVQPVTLAGPSRDDLTQKHDALRRLLSSPNQATQLASYGRKVVAERFTIDKQVEAIGDRLAGILAGSERR